MRFVDTNVLLYSVSTVPAEAVKAARAQELLKCRDLVLSVQVLQEFYVQATRPGRSGPLTHAEATAYIRAWRRFPTQVITIEVLDKALEIKNRYQLSYWDSAIVAAACHANCTEVISEDMNDGQTYDRVRVVNLFKA